MGKGDGGGCHLIHGGPGKTSFITNVSSGRDVEGGSHAAVGKGCLQWEQPGRILGARVWSTCLCGT